MATVAIIEDEGIIAYSLEMLLRGLGHEVVGLAEDGVSALELVRTHMPDVVFMDIRLAGPLDGIETARAMRTWFRGRVLFVTAHIDDDTRRRASSAEPDGFLGKPFTALAVASALDEALARTTTREPTSF